MLLRCVSLPRAVRIDGRQNSVRRVMVGAASQKDLSVLEYASCCAELYPMIRTPYNALSLCPALQALPQKSRQRDNLAYIGRPSLEKPLCSCCLRRLIAEDVSLSNTRHHFNASF